MYPDRLTAIASEALNRGATITTHNLGGLHAVIHHAGLPGSGLSATGHYTAPANIPDRLWEHFLTKHRTA
ncbi:MULTISPECIES: hypothetical protein [Nocardiaceae]|uniref:hypothetical protein n=1 Tax=Nocardiaceae TaxID=85025 RepID=UPI000563F72D|nr:MULTISPECIES: hypothetical protein [Rhodococcus]OZD12088.1 hypothetical protein CH248_29240 [Rhodococcus sp. 06-156-4a]OZD15757.1 hypothetical protein CH253_22580 [Rhodococcus sp. 06-156-3C]OZD21141.1 hypothetical protein CH280_02810 [Rhodococcus sp. 06-156-4C]OZD32324.1 hypothetical protein CH284_20740 [Rhodococcus sp. 06-156-3]OZD36545.1 hypothetical protein CH247_03165 [Rhodococcus sp. 06-156-3b]